MRLIDADELIEELKKVSSTYLDTIVEWKDLVRTIKNQPVIITGTTENTLSGWIPTSRELPKPTELCWVWFGWENKDGTYSGGFCDKMYLSSGGKWYKNALSFVKDEFARDIRAWQPYYEPEPYKESDEE